MSAVVTVSNHHNLLKFAPRQMLLSYARSQLTAASCRHSSPLSNLVNGQELTICDIVLVSPQSHSSLSVKPRFLWHALQWPWPILKRSSSDHWLRWRSKPGSRIVGSSTKLELITEVDCQLSRHRAYSWIREICERMSLTSTLSSLSERWVFPANHLAMVLTDKQT